MMNGRKREIEEIVTYERAVIVANLMQGKLNIIKSVFPEYYQNIPRRNLKAGKIDVKSKWPDVEKFYRDNVCDQSPKMLALLYEPLHRYDGQYRLPLTKFIELVGTPNDKVLKGAPLHSTVSLSFWGLQFEFPEMHLVRDLALAYNAALKLQQEIVDIENSKLNWTDAKIKKGDIAQKQSAMKFNMRMCLICCFNLVEAYINGIAWEYVNKTGIFGLSNNQKRLLEGDQTSILDKLIKIPPIIKDSSLSPLDKKIPPLSEFRDIIKPFRDSIVHASPYSAPERFGGYNRLSNIYDLELNIVQKATDLSLDIIFQIHRFVSGNDENPGWMLHRSSDGFFEVW